MKDIQNIQGKGVTTTMADVLVWAQENKSISPATRTDYAAQLKRCSTLCNVNDLRDVPADLEEFKQRFSPKSFPLEHFKTARAYQTWRKKTITVLKGFQGVMEETLTRRGQQDAWSTLIGLAEAQIQANPDFSKHTLIPIRLLADEARKIGLSPHNLSDAVLEDLYSTASAKRRPAVRKACSALERLRSSCPEIQALLPLAALRVPGRILRDPADIPPHLLAQIKAIVDEHCAGEIDDILEERVGAKTDATLATYTAALKKYVRTGIRIEAIPMEFQLGDCFERPVFLAVMKAWMSDTSSARKISSRSMRSYAGNVASIAARMGKPVDFMATALKTNRVMREGKVADQTMSPQSRIFCARLLQHRKSEMVFRSLHRIFQRKAIELMSEAQTSSLQRSRITQLGILAAFSAVALCGLPLRITNLMELRHLGREPSLILPSGSRKKASILIHAKHVKNKKPIRGDIADGPLKGVEVLTWYLDHIRPLLPGAEASDYVFPGPNGKPIDNRQVRSTLFKRTWELGIPMKPHNFRHGLTSLYLRAHPAAYSQAARLLGDNPDTVRKFYAWIDDEAEMATVQKEVAAMGRLVK